MTKVLIIGAGASGLAAAITAAKSGCKVTVIDHSKKAANKVQLAGNGRCNISNKDMSPYKYYGDKDFISSVLNQFDYDDVKSFFADCHICITDNDGYVYPRSYEAGSVSDKLVKRALELGVKIKLNNEIKSITKEGDSFVCDFGIKTEFDKVILCTGGKSYANTGSDGSGYDIAKSFGHSITEIKPALCAVLVEDDPILEAFGVRANGSVSCRGITSSGQIQFTDYGISGIPVFNISRNINTKDEIILNLAEDLEGAEFINTFSLLSGSDDGITLKDVLSGIFPEKLAKAIINKAGMDKDIQAALISNEELIELCDIVHNYKLTAKESRGFDYAQVTAGGICTEEIEPNTMESKLVSGLYFAGEIVDVDGICGGYNLHFAWATGSIAGKACGK